MPSDIGLSCLALLVSGFLLSPKIFQRPCRHRDFRRIIDFYRVDTGGAELIELVRRQLGQFPLVFLVVVVC